MQNNADDSGFFNDIIPEDEEDNAPIPENRRNSNEDEYHRFMESYHRLDRRQMFREAQRRNFSYDDLADQLDNLKLKQEVSDDRYKSKINQLESKVENVEYDKEKLQEDKDELKEELGKLVKEISQLNLDNEALDVKLKTVNRKLADKDEQSRFKDDKIKMLEQQYKFVKEMYDGLGGMFFNDSENKKKRK